MPEDYEKLIEALAKIERQLLWTRDEYKTEMDKPKSVKLLGFVYLLSGLFTAGVWFERINGIFHSIVITTIWPFFLGLRLNDLIEAAIK